MENAQTQSPENIFKQKVSQVAYDYIRTTYPDLVPYVITLKLEEIDIEKGNAAAIFIIKKGNDVAYIPTVIAENAVLSCEMAYYKNDNRFFPLIGKEVSKIILSNENVPSTLIKNPYINTTYNFFRNMYRPPITERIALAADSDTSEMVQGLPNKYKEAIVETLRNDKELLRKIAEFYPIESLLEKLKSTQEPLSKEASNDQTIQTILTQEDLENEEISKIFTKEAALDIAKKGYHLITKTAYVNDALLETDLVKNVVLSNDIMEYTSRSTLTGITCDVYLIIDGSLCLLNKAIIADNRVYHSSGVYELLDARGRMEWSSDPITLTVRNVTEGIDPNLFIEYGARYIIPFFRKIVNSQLDNLTVDDVFGVKKETDLGLFVSDKKGLYHLIRKPCERNLDLISVIMHEQRVTLTEDMDCSVTVTLNDKDCGDVARYIKVTDALRHSIAHEGVTIYAPSTTLVMPKQYHPIKQVTAVSLSQVVEHLKKRLPKYTLLSDRKDYYVKKGNTILTTFHKEASLADYLHTTLDISPENVQKILKETPSHSLGSKATNFYLMEKNAAAFDMSYGNQQGVVQQNLGLQSTNPATAVYKPNGGNPNLGGKGLPPVVDNNTLSIYANGFNNSLMDIGILSSLYNNDDIKTYLLDYIPQFTDTVSNLGKVILLFNINKEALIAKYGNGEYHSLISTLRKIFRSLAEIVIDLEKYISTLVTLPADKQHTQGLKNIANVNQVGNV